MRARGELSSLQVMWDPCDRSPQHHRLWPSGSLSGSPLADSSTAFSHILMGPTNSHSPRLRMPGAPSTRGLGMQTVKQELCVLVT